MHRSNIAYRWMLLSALSFSVMSFVAYSLRERFAWQTIASVRTGIALLFALALAWRNNTPLVLFKPGTLWIRSIAGSLALLANFFSLTHYPAAEVQALASMYPLWVALLSWPLMGESPRWQTCVAALLAVAGVFVLQSPQTDAYGTLPVLVAVGASLASSVALLGLHRLKSVHTTAVVAHFSGVSLLFTLAAFWMFPYHAADATSNVRDWSLLALVGCAATLGQLFLTKAFAAGPPAEVSVVGLTQVGFLMVLQGLLEQRRFASLSLLGFALVVGPTAWIMLSRARVRESD